MAWTGTEADKTRFADRLDPKKRLKDGSRFCFVYICMYVCVYACI